MADMRDRLIELLRGFVVDYGAASIYLTEGEAEILADMLLANGVILPPCKVGDTVYRIDYNTSACKECGCYSSFYGMDEVCGKHYELYPELDDEDDEEHCPRHYIEVTKQKTDLAWIVIHMQEFGKTVFLTREEAEKALREKEK